MLWCNQQKHFLKSDPYDVIFCLAHSPKELGDLPLGDEAADPELSSLVGVSCFNKRLDNVLVR